MSWSPNVVDTFNRANTSIGSAGSTTDVGNGWIDVAGIFNISSNTLIGTSSDSVNGYKTNFLIRQPSENAIDQRIHASFDAQYSTSGVVVRVQSNNDHYAVFVTSSGLYIFSVVGGNSIQVGSTYAVTGYPVGNSIILDVAVVGSNPTTFTISCTNSTGGSLVQQPLTFTDSTSGLQAAGSMGLITVAAGATETQIFYGATTYNDTSSSVSLSLSPTSLTSGTAGNVVMVSGIGTAFSGTPFVLTGGYGGIISAQSVASGTLGSVTISAGLPGQGALTLTDSVSGAAANISVSAPALGALKLGFIGDSITAGLGSGSDATIYAVNYLSGLGYTASGVNRGISGTTSQDWIPSGSYFAGALSAFQAAGVTLVSIMLGTNDARNDKNFTAAQHVTNMRAIVQGLVSAGIGVIIHKPIFTKPNAVAGSTYGGVSWVNDPNTLYGKYFAADVAMADGVTVFAGDTGAYQQFALNTALLGDGVHPVSGSGFVTLGQNWGVAINNRYGAVGRVYSHS